jgi:AcrR family transcriptional regulator
VRSDAALREALLALIMRQPYDQITVRDIVTEAGIGYATFFRHYPAKDALLDAIAGEEIAALVAMTAPLLSPSNTRASSLAVARHVAERREVWKALLTGGASGRLREQFATLAAQVPRRSKKPMEWLPADLGVTFGVTATVEILAWWLRQPAGYPVESVAEALDRLVIAPTIGSLKETGA